MHPPVLGLWLQCTSQVHRRKYRSRANLDAISIVDAGLDGYRREA